MKFLIVGNGGREHAFAWKLRQSLDVKEVYVAPGNAGTSFIAKNINIYPNDIKSLAAFAEENKLITIVGPENPLYLGIVDAFNQKNLPILGPNRKAAVLEYNKVLAKWFMLNNKIPTPLFKLATSSIDEMKSFIKKNENFLVVKRSGLCGGKGVTVCSSIEETLNTVLKVLETDTNVLVEEKMEGEELSFIVLTDGNSIIPMKPCRDYKPVFNNNKGPNTGGMGSYCPVNIPFTLSQKIMNKIVIPTIEGMKKNKTPYKGILYFGIMINAIDKEPYLLEYNARLGDPETQSLMLLLDYDLAYLVDKLINNKLHEVNISWKPETSMCVCLTSGGYPGKYAVDEEIIGLNDIKNGVVFHAGTKLVDNKILTSGGRVLGVSALDSNRDNCRDKIYNIIKKISFNNMHYRTDIGLIESHTPALNYLISLIGDLSFTDIKNEKEAVIRLIESHKYLREQKVKEAEAFKNTERGKYLNRILTRKLIPKT